ncbi:MAG: AcrR family transcriptional regulator [Arcticibacterium sp.]|jgi:AcrR family transcriptional regulator
MPLVKTNKEEIVSIAHSIFRKNRYFNTSMSDLARTSGLQKSSFYHYSPSEEAIKAAILDGVYQYLKEDVFSVAQ